MNILDKIIERKIVEVNQLKNLQSYSSLEKSDYFGIPTKSLSKNILQNQISIIAEHKRKSPSKKEINFTSKTKDIVLGYEQHGAVGISILTDDYFFGGSKKDLKIVKETCSIPLLRKDFIIDEFQIIESKSIGADAILLIAAILTKKQISNFSRIAKQLGLNVLTEIHSLDELHKCDLNNIDIVGVNNRDLKSFEVDINNSIKISKHIPSEMIKISESGIKTPIDIKNLINEGFDGFLIGERFMKSENPGICLKKFIEKTK